MLEESVHILLDVTSLRKHVCKRTCSQQQTSSDRFAVWHLLVVQAEVALQWPLRGSRGAWPGRNAVAATNELGCGGFQDVTCTHC
jgi:hypothetical protein